MCLPCACCLVARRADLCRTTDANTVDLHGLTLHHALSVTKAACNSWWSGCTSRARRTPLTPCSPPRTSLAAHHHGRGATLGEQQPDPDARSGQAARPRGLEMALGRDRVQRGRQGRPPRHGRRTVAAYLLTVVLSYSIARTLLASKFRTLSVLGENLRSALLTPTACRRRCPRSRSLRTPSRSAQPSTRSSRRSARALISRRRARSVPRVPACAHASTQSTVLVQRLAEYSSSLQGAVDEAPHAQTPVEPEAVAEQEPKPVELAVEAVEEPQDEGDSLRELLFDRRRR